MTPLWHTLKRMTFRNEELLSLFAADPRVARRRLREFVEENDPRKRWRQTCVRRLSDAEKRDHVLVK